MKVISTNERCTEMDYRRLFASSAEQLRWLCYTLTGDADLSDKALDAALEQSLRGAEQVFREWMLSWARRLIIKFCIATVRPEASRLAQCAYPLSPLRLDLVSPERIAAVLNLRSAALQQRLFQLDALSRFVFVLRALEGYTRHETSLLLNIDDRACEWIYVWAAGTLGSDVERPERSWTGRLADSADYCLAQAGD